MRVPIPSGSRLAVLNVPDDTVVLRPAPAPEAIADVRAAVRDALRFPLSGPPLESLVTPGGRVTLVVETPELPLPGAPLDPRREALASTIAELERAGVPGRRQTVVVAGGLSRRVGGRELEGLLPPADRRAFRGTVEVHDAEAPDLVTVGEAGGVALRVNRSLADTDLVVTVTAAETVLHGGPGALVRAASPAVARGAGASSLLETGTSQGWRLGLALERALSTRVPLIGSSLVLNQPRLTGTFGDYPFEERSLERLARSPLRRFSLLPGAVRRRILDSLGRELTASAAFAGPPSVAHAEALLRGIARRSVRLEQPLDALVIGLPWKHHHQPRERLNPITVAAVALGLALRLWRERFPVADGGTAILLHRLGRQFVPGTQDPYRALFAELRDRRVPDALLASEPDAAEIDAYRAGRACHPLQALVDWDSCRPALDRLGAVVVAGCRDHAAARALGFVPTHGVAPALEMAHGRAGGHARVGLMLGPPYFPLDVGAGP